VRCAALFSMSGRAQAPGAPEEVDVNPSEVAAQSASKLTHPAYAHRCACAAAQHVVRKKLTRVGRAGASALLQNPDIVNLIQVRSGKCADPKPAARLHRCSLVAPSVQLPPLDRELQP